jgi:uncharacterized repeat protein (TIGR03806 family)
MFPAWWRLSQRQLCSSALLFVTSLYLALPLNAAVSVLTYHNDNARTGQNTNETALTLGNVNSNSFGLISSRPVDDWVYAQPLIITNVPIPGKGTHNLLIVATVNDSIYAFDADDASLATPYWQTNYLGTNAVPPRNTDMTGACGGNYQDFHGNMGIVGTPVIDPFTRTLWVVVRTKENNITQVQRLHAIDLSTGGERTNSPVIISATYPGSVFDPLKQNQRPALLLNNGMLYIGWASHCDWGPYHGWLMAYNATNLQRTAVYNTTPFGGLGGIWQAGNGPAADTNGNLYFITGNGTFSTNSSNNGSNNFGDSYLKLATTNGFTVIDYFTPYNQASLESADVDLGSSGLLLLPDLVGTVAHPRLLVGAGKEGRIYLLDRDNMGKYRAGADTQILQSLPGAMGAAFDTPAYFNRRLYFVGSGDYLKSYAISNGLIITPPVTSPTTYGFPGATASVSANGTNNGIVWALDNSAWGSGGPAVLHAYNATNVAQELYNSNQAGSRDKPAGAVKFTVPTIANGKVYVGGQYALSVYGLGTFINAPVISPNGAVFTNSVVVNISDSTPGVTIYFSLDGTIPTTNSLLYTGPFPVTNTSVLKARAFKAGAIDSQVAVATFISSVSIGHGIGLTGNYYSNRFATNAFAPPISLVRTDAVVNFDWGTAAPATNISADHFTVKWTGDVQPIFTETYTFYTRTDDGVRLRVNNSLLIDKWVDQGGTEWSGTISLMAGRRYSIQMDFYENGGAATAQLSWSSPSTAKQIVPTTQLFPTHDLPPTFYIMTPYDEQRFTEAATVTFTSFAEDPDSEIARVDYFQDSTLLGSVTNAPYYLTLPGLPAGFYSFKAQAVDDGGLTSPYGLAVITVTQAVSAPYGMTSRPPALPWLQMPTTIDGTLPARLSLTGAFTNTTALIPANTLIPYTVNVPLWSDNAQKTRWLMVPNDGPPYEAREQIAFAPTGEWTFPAGTIFVKHFELATNDTNPTLTRRLETRLLVRDPFGSVYGVTYKWRPDNTDADLLTNSLSEAISITTATGTRTQIWYYPSPNDCLTCHTPAADYVLGVKARQLNGPFTYPSSGITDNQLRSLNRTGLFYPAFDDTELPGFAHLAPLTNAGASLEDRARSYLDANCAQCHRPGGTGPTFDARYDTPLPSQNIINAILQKGDLGYDNARVVVPKDVWRSVLYHRMNSTDNAIKMPQLARNLIDPTAVQVISNWINTLPGTPALAPPAIIPAGGNFVGPINVTLAHEDTNATLRYTLDSSLPTTNSPLYGGPFPLSNSVVLKAKAFELGFSDSVASSALFSIRPAITFASADFTSNNQFQLQLSGLAGKSYVFQATTNLSNWISLNTNIAPADLFYFLDSEASNYPARFYRAIELP